MDPWATIEQTLDPDALCFGVARELIKRRGACAHTGYPLVRALFARNSPDVDEAHINDVLAALKQLGAECDCQVADRCAEREEKE